MTTPDKLEEIKALKQKIAELENNAKSYQRVEHLLQAFNQASSAISDATKPEEIFDTVSKTLKGLGITSVIYSIDSNQENLIVDSISLDSRIRKNAEKLLGYRAIGYSIPIDSVDNFRISIRERKTYFSLSSDDFLHQILPSPLKKLSGKVAQMINLPGTINAPLISGDRVVGLLALISPDLVEEDIPLITAFAHQVASSWQKAKLYQQAQQELIERTQVENERLFERNRAQRYLDIAGVIIVVLDKDGNVELINQKGCEVLGWTEDELIGKNWFESVIPEGEKKSVLNAFLQLISGEIEPVEYFANAVLTKDGTQRIIAWHNALVTSEDGTINGTISSGENITERVLAETALRESEERFRSIVQSSPMGMHLYSLEPDERLVFVGSNPAADKILWVDNSRFIGKTIEEAFPALADTELPERYRRAAAYGESWQTAYFHYEDQWISGIYEVYAVQTSPGKMAAIFLDVTKRKRAIEEQERLVNILEATSDVVGTAKLSGQLIYLNKAGRRLFGLDDHVNLKEIDRIRNQPITEFLRIKQDSIDAALLYGIWSGETTIIDQYDQEIPFSIVLITHRDDERNPEFVSAVIRDISDIHQAEDLIQLQSTALDSTSTGIFIADHQGYIIWANPAISEITGFSNDEIIGKTPDIFSADDQSDDIREQILEQISSGKGWQGELTNRRKDGSTYISEQAITPVFNANGSVTHYISIAQDITKRKADEHSLVQRAAQLALLKDIGEQIVAVLDLPLVFEQTVQLVQMSFGYHHVGIYTVNAQEGIVELQAKTGDHNDCIPSNYTQKIGQGLIGWVAENNKYALSNDVELDKRYINIFPEKLFTKSELSVPIHMSDIVIGVLDAQSPHKDAFDESDVTVMQTLADQVAIAIDNAHLHTAIKRNLKETQAMASINQALNETLDLDRQLQLMVDSISQIIPHIERVVAHLYDEEKATLVPAAVAGISPGKKPNLQMQNGQGIAGEVIKTGVSINVRDTHDDPRFIPFEGATYLRSLLVVPIQSSGRRVGTISVSSKIPRTFTDEDERLLAMIGVQASIALQNARLYTATRRGLAESNMLFFINNLIVGSAVPDVAAILIQVCDQLWQNFGYYHVHIYLIDQESELLIANQGSGKMGRQIKEQGFQFSMGEGIVGYAARHGEVFVTNDVHDVPFYHPNPLLPNTVAELAAPLRVRDQILGVLDVLQQAPNSFDNDDFRFLTNVADQIAVVLDKAMLYNQLEEALEKEQRTRAQLVQTEKLAAMGRLIASVAHELNNPLQAIQNALYLVKLEEDLSPQAVEDLQVAIDEGSRMADLIARLRDTYRPVSASEYKTETINILVEEVRKLLVTHLRHNNITLVYNPTLDLPDISIIRDQIKQVILNLCINAIESMESGGQLTITSNYNIKKNEVQLSVSDTGPGMTPDVQDKIFEPFFTTKEGGTGLGLAVSFEIVQNHHGNLTAQNNDGPGSTFTLSLPCKQPMIE